MSHPERTVKNVPIERVFPEGLQTHLVTNMMAQFQPEWFVLSFFEMWPPPVLGDTEQERQKALDEIESVQATCVARLVVPPSQMREIVKTLQENLENYDRAIGTQPPQPAEEK